MEVEVFKSKPDATMGVMLCNCILEKRYSVYFLGVSEELASKGVQRGDGLLMVNGIRIADGFKQVQATWKAAPTGMIKLVIFKDKALYGSTTSTMNVVELQGPTTSADLGRSQTHLESSHV